MANDNETVAEIVKRVRRECNSLPLPNAAGEKLKLVREIADAHNREIAAKDAEIANLKVSIAEYERQPEAMADVATDALNVLKQQDEEIAKLRELVKDLADAMELFACTVDCDECDAMVGGRMDACREVRARNDALVARAREVCNV